VPNSGTTTTTRSGKRILGWAAAAILLPAGLFAGFILLDSIPLSDARPPENLQTLEEFRAWKAGRILGRGTYTTAGATYTVMLGPPGRYLASGPAAYLFDNSGRFVDWTSDKGDHPTVRHHFDLSGAIENFEREGQ
jgi:hypothetical protein